MTYLYPKWPYFTNIFAVLKTFTDIISTGCWTYDTRVCMCLISANNYCHYFRFLLDLVSGYNKGSYNLIFFVLILVSKKCSLQGKPSKRFFLFLHNLLFVLGFFCRKVNLVLWLIGFGEYFVFVRKITLNNNNLIKLCFRWCNSIILNNIFCYRLYRYRIIIGCMDLHNYSTDYELVNSGSWECFLYSWAILWN